MRSRRVAVAVTSAGISALLAACGSSAVHVRAPTPTSGRARAATTPSTRPRARPTTSRANTATTTTSTRVIATAPVTPPATTPPTTPRPTSTAPAPLFVTQVHGIAGSRQVITVVANGYGTSAATLTAYQRDANGWTQAFGPWFAYVGRNGIAPVGAKREGDGRTPSGVYGFDFMFGVDANPGVRFAYRRITGTNIVWDDDPASPNYNEWIDTNFAPAGANPEPMDNTPSYLYGAVVAYNEARTPGLGSAIFLHVSHGTATAGCVAVPIDELRSLLRWLDPAGAPRIAIGTAASLTG